MIVYLRKYTKVMNKLLSTGEYAKIIGVHPQTIRRYEREGKLKCIRTLGNHRRFEDPTVKDGKVVGYARVSTHDQKKDLETQVEVLKDQGVEEVIKDLGSGMNYKKAGFIKLLNMILAKQVKELVLTRKDRLLRFGSEIIFRICKQLGVKVTILYEEEKKEPMEQFCLDIVEIITMLYFLLITM